MKTCATLLVLIAACDAGDRGPKSKPAGASTPREGGTLRFSIKDQVRTLDPTIAYDEAGTFVLQPMLATLISYAPAAVTLEPDLAERWELVDGGMTYRFWLRPGIAYSDAGPIRAHDFKYALERALTTADSPFGPFLADVVGAAALIEGKATSCAGIVAASDRELVIKLVRPAPAFIYVLTLKFAAPQREDHNRKAGDQLRRDPLASGPYSLETWDEGSRVSLRKNPHYWNHERGHLDRIVMLENIPRDTQFLMFERGELDTAERLSAPDQLWITSQDAWKPYVHTRAQLNAQGSRMNTRVKPFDDRRVRQALNYALDKDHLLKLVNGAGVASHGMLPPGTFGRDATLAPYPHDPAKARALLAEAGYPDGLRLGYTMLNDEVMEKITVSMQGDLAEVGVQLDISVMSYATYGIAIGKADGPTFGYMGWNGDFPDPTNFLDAQFHSRMIAEENSSNNAFYANPTLDALLDAARAELDPTRREAMYRDAERILYDDAPWVWGYHPVATEVTQPYVRGYDMHPIWLRDFTTAWLDVGPDGEPVPR
jgi:ABC-type transport system substrate-binding protein